MAINGDKIYESKIDDTDRDAERETEGRRVLLPDVQRQADRATLSEEMEGYASKESGERTIRSEICKEESRT